MEHKVFAGKHRAQAEKFRVMADMMTDEFMRDRYLSMAHAYERLAEKEDHLEGTQHGARISDQKLTG